MDKNFIVLLAICLCFHTIIVSGHTSEANDYPFLYGELNSKYKGEEVALQGEIIDIKPSKQKYPLYKLNLRTKGVNNIWITSISTPPKSGIKIGDMIVFKGYITTTSELDPSGKLEKLIQSKTLLLAWLSQTIE